MNEQERSEELDQLSTVLRHVNKQLTSVTGTCAESQTDLRDTLESYWENTGRNSADTAQYIEAIDRQKSLVALTEARRRQLIRMADSPYFGRLDFTENDTIEAEQFYIGITTLTDEANGRLLVYDWRTPVAGMFYDFERGKAWYLCPAGKIEGIITRKRQYKISNGNMIYCFDADIKIDDELLQEVLSKNVDEQMHTIVTSIQREQNQIIRNQDQPVMFVQGPAGSGKTSIALHRIAFLLYRDRETLTAKNVLILSPNHLFSEYIASVLPEIGEENVLRLTFHDCVNPPNNASAIEIESRTDHLEALFSQQNTAAFEIRTAGIRYKSSTAFTQIMERYVKHIERQHVADFPAIKHEGHILFSRQDWQTYYLDNFSLWPPARRLTKIHELIQRRMKPLVRKLREQKIAEIAKTGEEVNERTLTALARLAVSRMLEPLYRQIDRLTALNPTLLYQRIFADEALFRSLSAGTAIPADWQSIKKRTLACLRDGRIPYEDSAPYLYLKGMLEGFAVKSEIKHLIIDEAQDYTTLQYQIMARLFPNCSWTVLGDPAQTVHPYLQTADFETAASIIGKDNPVFFRLQRSYRSTRQIQAFCQALLPPEARTESVRRDGPLPQLIHINRPGEYYTTLLQAIQELQAEGQQFIAIICKTAHASRTLFEALRNQTRLSLITSEEDEFALGTVVIPAYLAKGLEFDAVLVSDVDNVDYGREADRQLLYTICTRALHRLRLYHSGTSSPLISRIDPELYCSRE
ncbi:MAG: helD 1 [Anaerosporomusa subterranea]|jgi:DNA helicase-2/ATP-dependent DNA helicase PcrA|nr:helD 1 [Anaerosporomusa subterranea]